MAIISVLTLVGGRHTALKNLMHGLKSGAIMPDELIIIFMNEEPIVLPEMPFKVITAKIYNERSLPLAAARNHAAALANGSLLVFLDVDCIPSYDLLATYLGADYHQYLLSGQVRYLQDLQGRPLPELNDLDKYSKPDPIRSQLDVISYELFWSLNFACTKQTYQEIGGFDETFVGYGGEDTDFAFKAREKGISLQILHATAYHQHHEGYSPPLNHINDIIFNAHVFFSKWNTWPMQGWLDSFHQKGFISFEDGHIVKLKSPSTTELEEAKKT